MLLEWKVCSAWLGTPQLIEYLNRYCGTTDFRSRLVGFFPSTQIECAQLIGFDYPSAPIRVASLVQYPARISAAHLHTLSTETPSNAILVSIY